MSKPSSRSYVTSLEAFRSGTDSPRDFLERSLARLNDWEGKIRAFVNTNISAAREAADRSSERWRSGRPLSPIDGMPVGVKDIMETADMPTEQGSPLFAGWRSVRDAAAVSGLREAGAVILGKTVTTEFAATEPGPTRNPWDISRTPGGSSSGSAAAVAAGIVSAALGTQVIGSIIRPASYCGCYGYKPSVGSINRGGSFDHLSQSCAGVLAATLDELWIVAREIAARVGGDPGSCGLSGPRDAPPARQPRSIAVLRTAGFAAATSEAGDIFTEFQEKLQRSGIRLITRENTCAVAHVESAIHNAGSLSRAINAWESRWPLNTYARDINKEGLSQAMRTRLDQAEAMTLEGYRQLLNERGYCRALYSKLASVCDACITLSAPGPAPVGLASTGDPTFAIPASLLGIPAVSVPLFQADGLPLGLQVLGFSERDSELFSAVAFLQKLWKGDEPLIEQDRLGSSLT
jgi:Asp-tRNA(Asn)/Glu-tRNA(Gln) amidotransferase A subunit family amidase